MLAQPQRLPGVLPKEGLSVTERIDFLLRAMWTVTIVETRATGFILPTIREVQM